MLCDKTPLADCARQGSVHLLVMVSVSPVNNNHRNSFYHINVYHLAVVSS